MAVELPKMAGQCSSRHDYQLSRQRDLYTILVALLDLFHSHWNSKYVVLFHIQEIYQLPMLFLGIMTENLMGNV